MHNFSKIKKACFLKFSNNSRQINNVENLLSGRNKTIHFLNNFNFGETKIGILTGSIRIIETALNRKIIAA